jgi:hypothetical protein
VVWLPGRGHCHRFLPWPFRLNLNFGAYHVGGPGLGGLTWRKKMLTRSKRSAERNKVPNPSLYDLFFSHKSTGPIE